MLSNKCWDSPNWSQLDYQIIGQCQGLGYSEDFTAEEPPKM